MEKEKLSLEGQLRDMEWRIDQVCLLNDWQLLALVSTQFHNFLPIVLRNQKHFIRQQRGEKSASQNWWKHLFILVRMKGCKGSAPELDFLLAGMPFFRTIAVKNDEQVHLSTLCRAFQQKSLNRTGKEAKQGTRYNSWVPLEKTKLSSLSTCASLCLSFYLVCKTFVASVSFNRRFIKKKQQHNHRTGSQWERTPGSPYFRGAEIT